MQGATSAASVPARARLEVVDPRPAEDRILVVIPAHNESGALPALLRELRERYPQCDVVVIDDGSTDGTRDSAAGLARVISLPCNLGIGGAVQTGLRIAFDENYDYAVQVDGDGQHPPAELEKLLRMARKSASDLVVGSRFRIDGGFKSTAVRRAGIRFFAWFLSCICKFPITDPTSGFRVMNRRAIRVLAGRYAEDFPEVEAIVQAYRAGLRIAEVPVRMAERVAGESSIGPVKSLLYMLKVPLAILMSLLRRPEEP